jgi:elongation factor 2
MVQVITESSELVICAAGDLHLQVCMNILRNDYCNGIEIVQSPPTVPFRETVIASTPAPLLVKSANKHNRLWAQAEPLAEELSMSLF